MEVFQSDTGIFWSPDRFQYYIYFPHSTPKSSSDILWILTPKQKKNIPTFIHLDIRWKQALTSLSSMTSISFREDQERQFNNYVYARETQTDFCNSAVHKSHIALLQE